MDLFEKSMAFAMGMLGVMTFLLCISLGADAYKNYREYGYFNIDNRNDITKCRNLGDKNHE